MLAGELVGGRYCEQDREWPGVGAETAAVGAEAARYPETDDCRRGGRRHGGGYGAGDAQAAGDGGQRRERRRQRRGQDRPKRARRGRGRRLERERTEEQPQVAAGE